MAEPVVLLLVCGHRWAYISDRAEAYCQQCRVNVPVERKFTWDEGVSILECEQIMEATE